MGITGAIAVGIGSAYLQGEGQKSAAKYAQAVGNANARMAELSAKNTIERGGVDASNYGKKVNQTIGQQRVSYAAQGVDIASGSAADIQAETAEIGARDVMTIKNNAFLEAWGLKTQAVNERFKGEMGVIAADSNAKTSLVTGGLQGYMAGGGFKKS